MATMRFLRSAQILLFMVLGCWLQSSSIVVVAAFGVHIPTRATRPTLRHALAASSRRTIEFQGQVSSSMPVMIVPNENGGANSFTEWLNTPHLSDRYLLGTPNVERLNSNNNNDDENHAIDYRVVQPGIQWLGGVQLTPIFVLSVQRPPHEELTRNPHQIRTQIVPDQKTDSEMTGQANKPGTLSKLMSQATVSFGGGNHYTWKPLQNNEWLLETTVSLNMSITLPRLLPVPPGFQSLGTKIVQRTCQKRVEQTLNEVVQAYYEWSEEQRVMEAEEEEQEEELVLEQDGARRR